MADMYQPILNQSDFSPNTGGMVNRLKGSNAMGEAIADLGKMAITGATQFAEINKAKEIADVQAQVNAAIDPLIQESLLGSPAYQDQLNLEKKSWMNVQNRIPYSEAGDDSEALDDTLNRVESEIQNRAALLQKAKDQGRISVSEFEDRLFAITRKFVSNNPAYRKEILNAAQNRLEDNNIISRLKRDDKIAESQQASYEAELKFVQQELKDLKIPEGDYTNSDGSLNLPLAKQARDRMRRAILAKDATLADVETGKKLNEQEQRQVVESGLIPLVGEGLYHNARMAIAQIFQGNPSDFPKQKLAAKDTALREISTWRNTPLFRSNLNMQEVKDELALQEKNLLAFVSAMESFQSGDDANKFLSNQQSLMQNRQSITLMEKFNVPAWKFTNEIIKDTGILNTDDGIALKGKYISAIKDIFSNGKLSDDFLFNKPNNSNVTGASTFLKNAINGMDISNPESIEFGGKVIGAVGNAILDPNISPTPDLQMKRADAYIQNLGNPANVENFIDVPPEAASKVIQVLEKYTEQLDVGLQKYFNVHPDKAVKLEINPGTGMVYATGGDTDFNSTFTNRINSALKAYSNIRVQSPKEVWKDFYDQYFPSISQGKTLTSVASSRLNPLNLKDTKGEFRSFNSLEEAVGAYESQLLSYAAGKGVAGGKPRTTIKSIVDLWRPASDRRGETDISQEKYYNFLGDYLTKSPTTPLDLTDQETMAKLIAGMAQVESNTKLDVARVASFLKKSKTGKQKSEEEFRKSPEQKAAEEYSAFEQDMETRFPSRSQ